MKKSKDQMVFGVCGGLAEEYDLNKTTVRLITLLLFNVVLFPYLVLAVIMKEPDEN